uniref:NADH-ubiquinone oxidoreductase chain 3 n=1 Tax=Sipalinus gigas TaxID=1078824 RepID=A0A7H1DNR1_9CUCU|nr:NADH dehydrogenase subunit 3 [Sipalinus gigas]QNS38619.1 NADH dehydrogenase subunit 3 [Sipalinus gigas]
MLVSCTMIIMILVILILILSFISKKMLSDREKSSPFECGFDPKTLPRMPFSLHFFLVAILFVIFDVELTLLLPMIFALKISSLASYASFALSFISILLTGLFHEWTQGALQWIC